MRTFSAIEVERTLARLAANQHGVVSLDQLRAIGISAEAARHRVRIGRLHRIHRGVYAVGHPRLTPEGRWMAAVLACGPNAVLSHRVGTAVLSHRAAAALWRLLPARRGLIDVTVPGRAGRKPRRDIRLHRSTTLTQQATTRRLGIPVTSPARTLRDLRRVATSEELGRARRQAEVFGYPLKDAAGIAPEPTRSELERRFLSLCSRHRLPSPEVNVPIHDYVVDFLWRRACVIVETDGYRYHSGRAAFEHDYARQARLIALGFEVLRFTWRQVVDEPGEVVAALRARLTPALTKPGAAADRARSSKRGHARR
jgi:very-short-patch-repair endonuclease